MLSYLSEDSVGYVPDLNLIGTRWRHYRNKHIYVICGFLFNGGTDRWEIVHYDSLFEESTNITGGFEIAGPILVGPVLPSKYVSFVRTPESFFEIVHGGKVNRFEQVK